MVSKYCDHTPLYRQSGIYARSGVHIDRSTMAGWVDQGDALLDPLVAALGRYALAGAKVHADDTPVKVLDPGRGRTKTGRLWVYVRDDRPAASSEPPAVWFQYSPDRKGEHPQQHLKSFRGTLQADAYGGWGKLYESGRIREAACWAHAQKAVLGSAPEPGPGARDGGRAGAAAHCRALQDRGRHPGPGARGAAPTTPGTRRTAAEGPARVVERDARPRLGQVGARRGDRLQPDALAGVDALPAKTAASRSTTTPPSARCAASASDARTTSSWDRMPEESAPRRSTVWSRRPSSTGSIRRRYLREVLASHRRSSDQPHRRVAAVEHRTARSRATPGRLSPTEQGRRNQESNGVNSQGIDPRLIDTLNRASSLELFHLNTLIERMLADPRRIIAVRTNMHMGQTVRFLDWRDGQMRNGRVVAMGDAKVTLHEEGTRRRVEAALCGDRATGSPRAAQQRTLRHHRPVLSSSPARGDFRCGEKVSFEDKLPEDSGRHRRSHQPAHCHRRYWRWPLAGGSASRCCATSSTPNIREHLLLLSAASRGPGCGVLLRMASRHVGETQQICARGLWSVRLVVCQGCAALGNAAHYHNPCDAAAPASRACFRSRMGPRPQLPMVHCRASRARCAKE